MPAENIALIVFWSLVFILTLTHEIQSFNLTTIWFCISAFITLILAIFNIHWIIQIVVFSLLSTILLLSTKPFVKKFKDKEIIRTNVDRIIGLTAVITKEFSGNNYGEVIINNNYWRAVSDNDLDFKIGEEVIIERIEGIKVVISKKIGEE